MPMCCVNQCSNYKGFVFPKDLELKKKWLHAIGREKAFAPSAKAIVCEAHFTEEDFATEGAVSGLPITKRRRLKKGSIPSIFIWKKSNIKFRKFRSLSTNMRIMALTEQSSNKIFGGIQKIFSHQSNELGCRMNFAVFLPPTEEGKKYPVIYWLSGLTCTEANFVQKAGGQKYAVEHNVIIVCPDTSPRGLNISGDSESWDFGVGAGFYVDAIREPWKTNYRMFSYVTSELINIINSNFPVNGQQSIMGHSMGGHGALICALKNPGLYKSVSAFSPISNPSECPWGKKAFNGYLGPRESSNWQDWDATLLVKTYNGPPLELFVDQGTEDNFYKEKQLLPENLVKACKEAQVPIVLHLREGYDHSYFYIATFIGEHIAYHARHLNA